MMRRVLHARLLSFVAFAMLAAVWPMAAQAAGGGTAADAFSVLAGTAVTCTNSSVSGDVGVSPGTAVTQTSCQIGGTVHAGDAAAAAARAAFLNTYNRIAANLFPCTVLSGTLAGASLGAGTYCFPAAATLTGTLTLTGSGPWLFEIGTSGTGALTATNFTVVGGSPCNVTWWVRQAITLTTSTFQGTLLAGAAITLTGTKLMGRAWATTAVTLTDSTVSGCAGVPVPVVRHHCNQGVGNGPEGCDPGNSNNMHTSNDELGGTPGDPGRQPEK